MKKNIIILVLALVIIIGGGYGYFGIYKSNQEKKTAESDERINDIINKAESESFQNRLDSVKQEHQRRVDSSEHHEYVIKKKQLKEEEASLDKQLNEIKSDTFYKRHNN